MSKIDGDGVADVVGKMIAILNAYEMGHLVEVVRCGECTFRLVNSRGENKCWAGHDNGVVSLPLDWFCADGRKGEEDDPDKD